MTRSLLELNETHNSYKAATQPILREINEYQGRVMEKKRVHLSHLSECKMYDELIEESKAKISELEHDIVLREQLVQTRTRNREDPEPEESPTPTPTRPHERPTAYLPLCDDENTINVPRPVSSRVFGF